MDVIRPITLDDLPQLLELCRQTGFGLTTLPVDEKLLKRRIKQSLRGFEKLSDDDPPIGESYLLVLEETRSKTICGTAGVAAKVGGFEPFYAYRIETTIHASEILNVRKEIRTLHLVEDHDGPCEIGSLFLSPAHRGGGNGRLLSLSRFLLMANYPAYFDPIVIAEMRGVVNGKDGHSPFWEAIGRHFFEIDYPKADYMSIVNKRFIADLMPKHPIYIPLLPPEAQAVIGEVHPDTRPAIRILQDEGFTFSGMVDIFEAGPVVRSRLVDIRAIRQSRRAEIEAILPGGATGPGDDTMGDDTQRDQSAGNDAPKMLVSNCTDDFRATLAAVIPGAAGKVKLSADAAAALKVEVGDTIRCVSLKPQTAAAGQMPYPDANIGFD